MEYANSVTTNNTQVILSTNTPALVDSGGNVLMAPVAVFAQLVKVLLLVSYNGTNGTTYYVNCTEGLSPIRFTIGGQDYYYYPSSMFNPAECGLSGPMQGYAAIRIVPNTQNPNVW